MTALSLSLLGSFQASLGNEPLTDFRTRKVQALLVYLATEPEAHSRDSLMNLLWPGMPEKSARSNLRQILYYLRQAIPEAQAEDGNEVPVVIANRQEIRLNPQATVTVDTWRLETLLDGVQAHEHRDLLLCRECVTGLEEAVALYRGDFLSDFYLDERNEFEAWAQARRDYFRRRVLEALSTLTMVALRGAEYAEALAYAEKQLEIDNLRESATRQLMEVLALSGRREQALAAYERCRRVLAEELGMAPAARTTETYEKIRADDLHFDRFPPQDVRGYELKEQIGEGAYGAIYRAVQPAILRQVAVKVIRRQYADDPEFIRRFEAEAQTVARLEHPYIVPLYDYWRDPQGAYLVMRYMEEGSLLSSLETGPWDVPRTAGMVQQVAGALAIAHQKGIVHRDIKPGNILLDAAGNAYLADFGIAKDLTGERHMTAEDGGVGTLDYTSPEQITGEKATPQSDIYSLGAVLYETLTGEKPFAGSSVAKLLHDHLNTPMPLVTATRPEVPVAIDDVLQKATAKKPAQRYATVLEMAEAFAWVAGGLGVEPRPEEAGPAFPVPEVDDVYNPYKGLRPFQEADADDFFGRDDLIQQLIERLGARPNGQEKRLLALVGPSGSGKSSAVKAGLIPALRSGALPGSESWFVAEMVPGSHPLEELEVALWPVAVDPPPSLVEPMQRDTRGLLRTLHRILPDEDGSGPQLLLVIDQFEELFTLVEDEERRAFFLDSLLAALHAPRSPLRLLVTLRADFYDRPLQHQEWGRLLKENTEIVLPLNHSELTWAVREPARRMGVRLEEALVATIVGDVADQPGALPLLQYALTELFERRENGLIIQEAYREIGGVQGALGRRAEALYEGLDETGQEAARQLFLRLVTLGEGVVDTRRRVLRSEVRGLAGEGQAMDVVLERFGKARLLTFDRDPLTRAPTVEVAHEALLREWPRLRRWLDESRDDVRLQHLLARAAGEWVEAGRDASYLLHGSRLDHFGSWVEETQLALTQVEKSFLAASLDARRARQEEEEARRQRELRAARDLAEEQQKRAEAQARAAQRLRRRALYLAGVLALALVLALAAGLFAREASRQRANVQEQLALTRSRELALAALTNLEEDAELSMLLALAALSETHTVDAEEMLHQAILADRLLLRLENGAFTANQVAYSPDGVRLATLALPEGAPQTLTVWDAVTGEELVMVSPGYLFDDFAFSPDGAMLVTAPFTDVVSEGATLPPVHLWDATSGRELAALELAGGDAHSWCYDRTAPGFFGVDISSDGTSLATIHCLHGEEGVAIWDIESAEQLLALPVELVPSEFDFPPVVRFSPDGRYLAASTGGVTVIVWDSSSGETMHVLESRGTGEGAVVDLTFSGDSRLLATAGLGGTARIWDVATGEQLLAIDSGSPEVWGVAFHPDGSQLATAAPDGTTRLWDVETGRELLMLSGAGERFNSVAFHPDGDRLVTADWSGSTLVWDLTATGEFFTGQGNRPFENVHYAPDGTRIVAGDVGGRITIWELATGRELASWQAHDEDHWTWLSVTLDGAYIASGGKEGEKGQTKLWDAKTGELQWVSDEPVPVWKLDISPDGTRLALGSWDMPFVTVRDLATGEIVYTATGTTFVSFDPLGEHLAVAAGISISPVITLFDARSGETSLTLETDAPGGGPSNMTFSPDGRLLAVSSFGGSVTVLDSFNGNQLLSIKAHDAPIWGLAYGPDGRRLATGSIDGTVKLWDAESGFLLLTLEGFGEAVSGVAFSADGSRLIASSYDATVRGFLLDPDELVALAHERLTRSLTDDECRVYLHVEACP